MNNKVASRLASRLFDGELVPLVEKLWPLFREKLMAELGPELLAIARAASADSIGLDHVALAALADWLEESRLPGTGNLVRRIAINNGDLIVISPANTDLVLSSDQAAELKRSADINITIPLRNIGRNVVVVINRGDVNIDHFANPKQD